MKTKNLEFRKWVDLGDLGEIFEWNPRGYKEKFIADKLLNSYISKESHTKLL